MVHKKTTEELVGERPSPEKLTQLPRTRISVIADNLRSLDNVGLLFRLCELIRAEHLYLTGYTGYPEHSERHSRRIGKTAVYAVPHQPWTHTEDPIPIIENLKADNYNIIALEQTDRSIPYHTASAEKYRMPLALILGHEREGVREELLPYADTIIDIPILGLGNSHNVTISTGIVLYHILEKTDQI